MDPLCHGSSSVRAAVQCLLSKMLMLQLLYGSLGYRILIVILDSTYLDRKTTAARST